MKWLNSVFSLKFLTGNNVSSILTTKFIHICPWEQQNEPNRQHKLCRRISVFMDYGSSKIYNVHTIASLLDYVLCSEKMYHSTVKVNLLHKPQMVPNSITASYQDIGHIFSTINKEYLVYLQHFQMFNQI